MMKAMDKEAVLGALRRLGEDIEVFCPVSENGSMAIKKLLPGDEPFFGGDVPFNSIKEAVFPQTEKALSFRDAPSATRVEPAEKPKRRLVIGGPPCDARALTLLDKVFLQGEFEDEMYKTRRALTTVVTKACSSPGDFCFCTAVGCSPASSEGSDALFFELASEYVFLPLTEKGQKFLDLLAEARPPGDESQEKSWREALEKLDRTQVLLSEEVGRNLEENLPSWLLENFDLPLWEEMSKRCLGCGACTYTCPTCHCFALVDSSRGSAGVRYRVWDSCKFQEFLLMAGGHNPRPTKKERTRQRFLHKLSYYPDRYGQYLCVGCGRCLRTCPVGIHVPSVLAGLQEVRGR